MMERNDVVALGEKTLQRMIAFAPADAKSYLLRMTSGSSRGAPLLIATEYDRKPPIDFGTSDTGCVVACSGSLNTRLSVVVLAVGAPQESLRILVLDPSDLQDSLGPHLSDLGPEGLQGICSFLARLAPYISPKASQGVKVLRMTGEPLSVALERKFIAQFRNARHEQMYLAVELGRIGMSSCRQLSRNQFHPAPGVSVRIDNLDSTGAGEVLVTKSFRERSPIADYRIGDVGRVVEKPCACGAPTTFEILGRSGIDYIKICGALLRREALENAIYDTHRCLIDDYRAEAREVEGKGEIALRLRLHAPVSERLMQEIGERIERNLFLTPGRTLADLTAEGSFLPLRVEFTTEPFVQMHKDVKLFLRCS
jgi:phenylacetate-coenzyme A ligase PaaK-like adenylate-forming protein